MSRRAGTRRLVAAAVMAMLGVWLQAGCGHDDVAPRPAAASCAVSGRVSRFGAGVLRLSVRYTRVGAVEGLFEAPVDSLGNYRIDLPAGDYLASARIGYGSDLWLGPHGSLVGHESEADTLRLDAGTPAKRVDFPFGGMRVTGAVPADLTTGRLDIQYWRTSSDWLEGASLFIQHVDVTDGALGFDSAPLVPGDYHVEFVWRRSDGQYGERYWLPGVAASDDATSYHVGVDSLCAIAVDFPGPVARLAGSVTGAWQAMGLNPPRVEAYDLAGVSIAGPWQVGADGRFTLEFHRPVPVRLLLSGSNDGFAWIGGRNAAQATVFTPVAGSTIDGVDAVVGGAIIRATTAVEHPRSTSLGVLFCDPVDQAVVLRGYANFTRDTAIGCLPPGQYLLRVDADVGYDDVRPQWYDRAATPAAATLVTVPAGGGVLHVDFVMERGGTIAGTFTSTPTMATWGVVLLTAADDSTVIGSRWTAGPTPEAYVLRGIPEGAYKVAIRPGGSAVKTWYPGTTDWSAAAVLVISGANDITGIDFNFNLP